MAEQTTIIAPELDALLDRISKLSDSQEFAGFLLALGNRIGTQAEGYVREGYPPAPHRPLTLFYTRYDSSGQPYQSKFKNMPQQRKVMMLVKEGKVPYKRTGWLGNSMTHETEVQPPDSLIVHVGTNDQKAPWVIGSEDRNQTQFQSHYHKETGWLSLPTTLDNHVDDFKETAVAMAGTYLRGLLSGGQS